MMFGVVTLPDVITNDVLYQLSYCGKPWNVRSATARSATPDIGHGADWQGKRTRLRVTSSNLFSPRAPPPAFSLYPPKRDKNPRQPACALGWAIWSENSSFG